MTKEELRKVLEEIESTISYNNLDKYDTADSGRYVYDVDGVVIRLLLARDTLKKLLDEEK